MKRRLLIAIAAISVSIGWTTRDPYAPPYYFKILPGYNKPAGSGAIFLNHQVQRVIIPPLCDNYGPYDCVVTFVTQALTQTNYNELKGIHGATPRSTVSVRIPYE